MTVTLIEYVHNPSTGLWECPGRAPLGGRASLIGGTYVPGPETTGPVGTLTDMYASSGAILTPTKGLGAGYVTLPSGTYEGLRIWAQVRTSSANVVLRNCEILGPDPDTMTGLTGLVRNFNAYNPHIVFEDCRFTQLPWTVDTAARPLPTGAVRALSPNSAGIHGGNFTLRRSEIVDVQDAVNYVQNLWGQSDGTSNCLIEQSWLHRGYHQNNWTTSGSPSNRLTHNDGFQPSNGKNIIIRWSKIGGRRDQAGYDRWPGGSNDGDDFYSSGLQLQQEIDDTAQNRIENVEIYENWIDGGMYGINISFKTSRPSQTFSTFNIHDNQFLQRPSQSAPGNWSNGANNPTLDVNGNLVDPDSNFGGYIIRGTSAAPTLSNNRIVDPFTLADLGAATVTVVANN